jgi:cysteinyl-tRNA synthetase
MEESSMTKNIRMYDTMSREKKPFAPLNPPVVTMYVCGPTVYGEPHIGNLRSFTSGDLIRRWLEFRGYDVRYVMNITDIEDKTIRDSGKAGQTLKEFTEHYTEVFFHGLDLLNIKRAIAHPRATIYVPQMIEFIKELEEKGYAYETEDGVYYDIDKFPNYGKLSGVDITMTERTERVSSDEYDKEDAQDFTLWKKSTSEEIERGIFFESPWGKGRPGWHIECSVMNRELLGETIDIHAGGEDLAFPHHENEVAQTEALTGKPFVRYWLHMRHLMIDGGRMGKSLGNYVSLDEVLEKHSTDAFRYFYLGTQYRRPLNFTWSSLESAQNTVDRIENTLDLIENALRGPDNNIDFGQREANLLDTVKQAKVKFSDAMDDDFNTPIALIHLHAIREALNEYLTGPSNKGVLFEAAKHYRDILNVLGLFEKRSQGLDELTNKLIDLVAGLRQEQREAKNYALADDIRNKLAEIGIELQDTKEGAAWKIAKK